MPSNEEVPLFGLVAAFACRVVDVSRKVAEPQRFQFAESLSLHIRILHAVSEGQVTIGTPSGATRYHAWHRVAPVARVAFI